MFISYIYIYSIFLFENVWIPLKFLINYMTPKVDVCLIDYATTHTILCNKKYFLNSILTTTNVDTISSCIH